MNIFSNLFKCKICDNTLKNTVLLPCGESICFHHTLNVRSIDCHSCHVKHLVPPNGFPHNKLLNILIDSNIQNFDMGEEYKDAMHSCSCLEKTLDEFEQFISKPNEYVNKFYDKLKHSVDLKREEVKFENEKKIESLFRDLNSFETDLIFNNSKKSEDIIEKLLKSYISQNEISHLFTTTAKRKLISVLKEKLLIKKDIIEDQIDESYLKLINDVKTYEKMSSDSAENFQLNHDCKLEIEKLKKLLHESLESLKVLKIDRVRFKKIRDDIDNGRSYLNLTIRKIKEGLMHKKGFDFESEQFNFPKIPQKNELGLKSLKNEGVIELVVNGLRARKQNGIKDDDIVYGEKVYINEIPFYAGMKFEKGKKGEVNCLACLYCSNEYDFSGIDVEYTMKLLHKEYPDMDIEKQITNTFKHFSDGFKRLITLDELIKKYSSEEEDQCILMIKIKVLKLHDRRVKKEKNLVCPKSLILVSLNFIPQLKRDFKNLNI
ncbi:unnamed protein product [Brachionus calyciflorus]|uniref:Uncharacterized protein n=1 Tax=Brachionus calyciflorus TaxID=104777 RepID=A0A814G9Y2_9BILA|nr:unnamed protein product [Brachionus calyciflorus]